MGKRKAEITLEISVAIHIVDYGLLIKHHITDDKDGFLSDFSYLHLFPHL